MTERIRTLLDLIRDHVIVRRLVLFTAIVMCWRVSVWGMQFAVQSDRPGLDIAAIVGAVTAPITLFAGAVFRAYVEGRKA